MTMKIRICWAWLIYQMMMRPSSPEFEVGTEVDVMVCDTTKRLMSSSKYRSVEVINNPARPGSNHREVNCINYK